MLDRKIILNISLIIQLLLLIFIIVHAGINCYKNASQILPNILWGEKIDENCTLYIPRNTEKKRTA